MAISTYFCILFDSHLKEMCPVLPFSVLFLCFIINFLLLLQFSLAVLFMIHCYYRQKWWFFILLIKRVDFLIQYGVHAKTEMFLVVLSIGFLYECQLYSRNKSFLVEEVLYNWYFSLYHTLCSEYSTMPFFLNLHFIEEKV